MTKLTPVPTCASCGGSMLLDDDEPSTMIRCILCSRTRLLMPVKARARRDPHLRRVPPSTLR